MRQLLLLLRRMFWEPHMVGAVVGVAGPHTVVAGPHTVVAGPHTVVAAVCITILGSVSIDLKSINFFYL
jgi:hypothetical protein